MILEKLSMPRVSIIILNWNSWKDTIECLKSVYQIRYPNYEVIIVDNGSKNESIDMIKKYCKHKIEVKSNFIQMIPDTSYMPIQIIEYTREEIDAGRIRKTDEEELPSNSKLVIIKNEINFGFAEGNNIGIRYALSILDPDYVLLLNSDTVVESDFLGALVKVAESNGTIGVVGPKVYYYDYGGRRDVINFAGGKLDMRKGLSYHIGINEVDIGQYDEIEKVDYIEGCALLIKKNLLNTIGLIDPSYFAYWEENDFCMRASNAGYWSAYVPNSKIWHKISSSIDPEVKIFYLTRNRFLFIKKYSNKRQYFSFLLYFFGFDFWMMCYSCLLIHKSPNRFIYFLKGILCSSRLKDIRLMHQP